MNNLVVFLSVLLVVVIFYMIYSQYISTNIETKIELDMSSQLAEIASSSLVKPDAVVYTYKVWIYVNRPIGHSSFIFKRDKDLSLDLNGVTSVLSLTTKHTPADDKTHMITNNFPLQKWVYVVISVDNSTIDMYLDGKLVKSVVDQHLPDRESPITFGVNTGVFMSKFNRVLGASNPQTVWSEYLSGSGSAIGISSLANKYNINVNVLKDNVLAKSVSLW